MNLSEGRAYRYLEEQDGYEQIPLEVGIAHAFEDVEQLMGWLRPGSEAPPG